MYPKINQDENINKTMESIKAIVFNTMILIIIALIACLFLKPLPIVKYSTSTGKCVEIEYKGECYDCSMLKEIKKYKTEFVK